MRSIKKLKKNTNKKKFNWSFGKGISIGVIATGLIIFGITFYLYHSTNKDISGVYQKINRLLSQELDRQQVVFTTNMNQLVDQQSITFQKLANDAREEINTNFDQKVSDAYQKINRQLSHELDRQQIVFTTNMNQLVDQQSITFQKLASDAQKEINTNFNQKFTTVVTRELTRISDNQTLANKNQSTQAFLQAVKLVKNGQISEAGIYFSNACYKDPSNIEHLVQYVEEVIQWAQGVDDVEYAIQVLSELKSFSASQLLHINVDDIKQGELILTQIEAKRSTFVKSIEKERQTRQLIIAKTAITYWKQLGTIPDTTVNSELEKYKEQLMSLISTLDAVRVNQKDFAHNIYLESMKTLREVKTIQQILSAGALAEKYMKQSQKETIDRELCLRFLSQSEAIVNQMLIGSVDLSPNIKNWVYQLKQKSNSFVKKESIRDSREILSTIKEQKKSCKYLPFNPPKEIKYQVAIEGLEKLINDLSVLAQGISDQSVLNEATALIKEINAERLKWTQAQYIQYNLWASKTAKDFFDQYKVQLNVIENTNESLLHDELLQRFGPIDMRLLSVPAAQARNEVFNLFYAELDKEQQIDLSSKLVMYKKRKMSDL